MKKLFLISTMLFLSACGSKLEGQYKSNRTMESFTFNSNGTVTEAVAGVKIGDFPYKVDGNKIQIDGISAPFILNKDGSFDAGPHGVFAKK